MRNLFAILLLCSVGLLTGCAGVAEELWMWRYRQMGGWGEEYDYRAPVKSEKEKEKRGNH
jgi:hypothetical protein